MRRLSIACLVAVATGLTVGGSASAAGWTTHPEPRPTDSMAAVSCDTGPCIAVGQERGLLGELTALSQTYSGTWGYIRPPAPSGARSARFADVSCNVVRPALGCVAVGSYVNAGGTTVTLATNYVSGAWTTTGTINPAGARSAQLDGVSCSSPTTCVAVGSYVSGGGARLALAEQWNGTTWTLLSVPLPAGATASELSAVACTSATACEAVGSYVTSGGTTVTFAAVLATRTWTVRATPNPAGARSAQLSDIACASASACTAVGRAVNASGTTVTLAESWNGAAWTLMATPNPSGARAAQLSSVHCIAASTCTAVGSSVDATGTTVTLAAVKSVSTWTLGATATPAGATSSSLSGISCASGTACVAVGTYDTASGPAALVERWNGSAWRVESSARPVLFNLNVSCISATDCWSGGAFRTAGSSVNTPLVEHWDGSGWTAQAAPGSDAISALDCAGTSACMAATSGYFSPFVRWDGSSWTTVSRPAPAGATQAPVLDVACSAANACTAVGYYTVSGGIQSPLAMRWDGTSWTLQSPPVPAGTTNAQLWGVSCASASSCVAVGYYFDASLTAIPFAEHWDGTTWTLDAIPVPGTSVDSVMQDVSCTSPTSCTGVGRYTTTSIVQQLTVSWDGTSWTAQPNTDTGILRNVSCAAANDCLATGAQAGTSAPIAGHWDGTTWTATTPPPAALGTTVYEPSCVGSFCMVMGLAPVSATYS